MLRQALEEMQEEGKDLPPVKRPLNKLLRFFTGSFKQPVEGWKNSKVEFLLKRTDRCIPLIGKTCFNELRIPSDSFRMPRKLSQVERDDCGVRGLRGFCHRVVSICGRTTQPTQPAMRQRRQKGDKKDAHFECSYSRASKSILETKCFAIGGSLQ